MESKESKSKKSLKILSISSLIVGFIAMLFNSWWLGAVAIVLAFFLYRQQKDETDSKKYFIMAIIAGVLGCIGIVDSVMDKVEQKKKDEMRAKNESFIANMENFVSELSSLTIENEYVKINGDISKFFKVKSVSIEPQKIEKDNYSKSLTEEEFEENDFVQKWTAKLLFERSGIKLSSKSDTYYTGNLKIVFEDESGYPISETEITEDLGKEDFYKSIGETIAYEYTFKLGKGKDTDALSKIKSLKIDSEIEKGSHYQDQLEELQNAVNQTTVNKSNGNSSGSNDWDEVLDEYEDYVDKYISLYKKAMKGDASALSEYPGLMKKAESFSTKLQKAGNDLSAAQMSRYTKITMKMANAIK